MDSGFSLTHALSRWERVAEIVNKFPTGHVPVEPRRVFLQHPRCCPRLDTRECIRYCFATRTGKVRRAYLPVSSAGIEARVRDMPMTVMTAQKTQKAD